MLGWVYLAIMLAGGGVLLLGTIISEAEEAIDSLSQGIDGILESVGIDLFPDGAVENDGVFSLRTLAAFFCLFGAGGLISYTFFHTSILMSVVWAIVAGAFGGFIAWMVMRLLMKQQATSSHTDIDYIGVTGTVSSDVPVNGIGQGVFTIKNMVIRISIREEGGFALSQGTTIKIVRKEGTLCVVQRQLI